MKAIVRELVEVEIDAIASPETEVEIQPEAGFQGFKLYIHEMGRTVLRMCKIQPHLLKLPDRETPPPPPKVSERHVFTDWGKLEQQFKDAIGPLPNYRRGAAFAYVNALKNEIIYQQQQVNEIAEHNAALHKRYRVNETDAETRDAR